MRKDERDESKDERDESLAIDPMSFLEGGESPDQGSTLEKSELKDYQRQAKTVLAREAPKAASRIADIMNGQVGDGAREQLAAAESILDRVGIGKSSSSGADPHMNLPMAAMAAALIGMSKVLNVQISPSERNVTPKPKRIKKK